MRWTARGKGSERTAEGGEDDGTAAVPRGMNRDRRPPPRRRIGAATRLRRRLPHTRSHMARRSSTLCTSDLDRMLGWRSGRSSEKEMRCGDVRLSALRQSELRLAPAGAAPANWRTATPGRVPQSAALQLDWRCALVLVLDAGPPSTDADAGAACRPPAALSLCCCALWTMPRTSPALRMLVLHQRSAAIPRTSAARGSCVRAGTALAPRPHSRCSASTSAVLPPVLALWHSHRVSSLHRAGPTSAAAQMQVQSRAQAPP